MRKLNYCDEKQGGLVVERNKLVGQKHTRLGQTVFDSKEYKF